MRLVTLLLTCLVLLTLCPPAGAQPGDAARTDTPTLSVCLAVPDVGYDGEPIYLNNKSSHFHVVIQNVSGMPQKIWSENCGWGDGLITLEVTSIDGKALPKPQLVRQNGRNWGGNVPQAFTLQPGEMLVREVHLHIPKPIPLPNGMTGYMIGSIWPDYDNFPIPMKRDTETVSVLSPVRTFTVTYRPSEPMF